MNETSTFDDREGVCVQCGERLHVGEWNGEGYPKCHRHGSPAMPDKPRSVKLQGVDGAGRRWPVGFSAKLHWQVPPCDDCDEKSPVMWRGTNAAGPTYCDRHVPRPANDENVVHIGAALAGGEGEPDANS